VCANQASISFFVSTISINLITSPPLIIFLCKFINIYVEAPLFFSIYEQNSHVRGEVELFFLPSASKLLFLSLFRQIDLCHNLIRNARENISLGVRVMKVSVI
jgi:hypothetical protein